MRPRISALVPALTIAIGAWWTVLAAWRTTFAIFGRDQGIFQYVAWAIGQGERDYVDFREINGPLPHLWHIAFQHLGGADEHCFRVLDTALSWAVFLLVGAVLPGISRRKGDRDPPPSPTVRALWAAATSLALMSQYVSYGWWQTAQRESLYDLLLLASIALQIHAQRPGAAAERPRSALLAVAGALGALTWFGKPTCLAYTAAQGVILLLDRDAPGPWRRRLGAFAMGCASTCIVMLGVVVWLGDLRSYVAIVFGEVPRLYRYIWSRSVAECYVAYGNAPRLNVSVGTLALGLAFCAVFRPPRRFWLVLVLLACGLILFFAQGKGFPYHLHPVTAGARLVWLGVAMWAGERGWHRAPRAAAVGLTALGALIGSVAWVDARGSEAAQNRWDLAGATPALREGQAYFAQFPWGDFFPWDLRRAAAFLQQRLAPGERVQNYGMDPYLFFLARRKSATPYMYSFELNVDAALEGGSGGRPDAKDREWLLDTARRHEHEMLVALQRSPPAAFAFIDRSPFTYAQDSVADFDEHCPNAAHFLHHGYAPAGDFGAVHVWLRNDVLARGAQVH